MSSQLPGERAVERDDAGCIYWVAAALHDVFRAGRPQYRLSDRQILAIIKASWRMLDDKAEAAERAALERSAP